MKTTKVMNHWGMILAVDNAAGGKTVAQRKCRCGAATLEPPGTKFVLERRLAEAYTVDFRSNELQGGSYLAC